MKVYALIINTLRLVIRDKSAVIWMLLIPLFYILIFGNSFRSNSSPKDAKADLQVWNQDDGLLSQRLLEHLSSENLQIHLQDSFPSSINVRFLTIPDSFSARVLANKPVELPFVTKSGTNQEAEATAEMALRKATMRLMADLARLELQNTEPAANQFEQLDRRASLVSLHSEYSGKYKIIPSGYNHQVPANIIMFTLIIVFIYAGEILMEEREKGMLSRIRLSPISENQFFLGKWTGTTLIGLIQMIILIAAGRFLFDIHYGPSLAAVILLALVFAACCAAMGLTLAMLVKRREQLNGIALMTALGMAALSGCWWPIEIVPGWMAVIARILPSGIALRAFHQLISYGHGLHMIIPHLFWLLAFNLSFALLFAFLLRRNTQS
ncbi:MAG: ABC transporter permease [candidate division KSB1 bacterium]|nr:ABC transporter permease [candidate division KSB1 bacterium]